MIKKMNATEQKLVVGGDVYHVLEDGRVLLYLTENEMWYIYDTYEEAEKMMWFYGKQLSFFKLIMISPQQTYFILQELGLV